MITEKHGNQLLKVLKSHKGSFGVPCTLDFSNEEHFKCVEYLFGGEDLFDRNYPKSYLSAILAKEYEGEEMLNENQKAGFKDITDLLDISYHRKDKKLFSCGSLWLTEKSPRIYITISVMRSGKRIGYRGEYFFRSSLAKIDITIPNIEFEVNNNDVSVVIHDNMA